MQCCILRSKQTSQVVHEPLVMVRGYVVVVVDSGDLSEVIILKTVYRLEEFLILVVDDRGVQPLGKSTVSFTHKKQSFLDIPAGKVHHSVRIHLLNHISTLNESQVPIFLVDIY